MDRIGDDTNADDLRLCFTVEMMLEEYYKHTQIESYESFYAPYLQYLFEDAVGGTTRGLLPSVWSEAAKDIMYLFLDVQADGVSHRLRPFGFEYGSIFDFCDNYQERMAEQIQEQSVRGGGNAETVQQKPPETNSSERNLSEENLSDGNQSDEKDSTEEKDEGDVEDVEYEDDDLAPDEEEAEDAYMFLVSRGWYDKLIPVVDMLNHRNGPGRNVEVTPIDDKTGEDVAAYAWRDITAGDQLQYTYSECMDATCGFGEWKYEINTQWIFVEFGFVELYPRRFVFDVDLAKTDTNYHQELTFEITTEHPNDENSKRIFKWIAETPDEKSVAWMRKELARLKSIETRVRKEVSELERVLLEEGGGSTVHNVEHERDTILEYYEAYLEAFELALEHKDDPVGITLDDFKKHLEKVRWDGNLQTMHDLRKHPLLLSRKHSKPGGDEF
jgi:hypothetical protein